MIGIRFYLFLIATLFSTLCSFGTIPRIEHDTIVKKNNFLVNVAPILVATGNQIYCPGSAMKIVTNMTITDPDDTGIDAMYIQISSGYINGQDLLTLTGVHPTITSSWNAVAGKLTLTGVSSIQPTYVNLVNAIKDIEYSSSSATPSGIKNFSITVGQANYLPSNGHYYQYISNIGISWSSAKIAAQASSYYGLQGYLATITSAEEAQISGEQASGAGWIGGSDEEVEGTWKWMTGPEIGLVFWTGAINGSTTNFEFWNTGEPNNSNNNEDYAHVTAPGVGIPGSWNDLSNIGENTGNYQPKGYIVEYGGTVGDPTLQISTSTTIAIPSITTTISAASCGSGSVTLTANAANGTVSWYDIPNGGTPIASGNSFTTPILSATTSYYATAFSTSCATGTRIPIVATINQIPVVSVASAAAICENNTTTLTATTSVGTIQWYSEQTGGVLLASGAIFTTTALAQNTTFYVDATNNGCTSGTRIPVTVVVNTLPNVVDETLILCENTTKIIDAGIPSQSYLWSTGETTQTISVSGGGVYSVVVTSPENCSKTKIVTVIQYDIPEIEQILVNDNVITIVNNGFGDYEFSIDGLNYQDSNIFSVIQGGLYTAYVRSKNDCGEEDTQNFVVLSIPKFFTPNNDGVNDTFYVKGMIYYPKANVRIFDRYGKFVGAINANSNSWDGNYKGEKLPSSDYWYIIKINDSLPEITGHFSIKR